MAGALCGIEPMWASEIEPYPIAVTKSRLPKMKHLGDISKINGAEIEPVDIITFGSPCQDLSVAGKRAGLKHQSYGDGETTRSGLFMEAVRIIKEMREKTNGKYPRFALWENVPGAFSSNKGEDFKVVLEELIKIVTPSAVMPEVPKFGWPYADSYCGDGWSLAYRVLDAQYWGVPQRRRRIYLVADFGGQCAREILFEREGLRGYFTEGRTPWQKTPDDAERSVGADDREGEATLKETNAPIIYTRGYGGNTTQNGISPTIEARAGTGGNNQPIICMEEQQGGADAIAYSFDALSSNSMKSSNPHSGCREVKVARTIDTSNPDPSKNQGGIAIVEPKAVAYGVVTKGNGDAFISKERHTSLCSGGGQAGQGYPCVMAVATQQGGAEITENGICPTITAAAGMSGNNQPWICKTWDARGNGDGKTVNTITGDHENRITDYTSLVISKEIIALEGNGQRPSHRGDGYLVTDKSYTLNATEQHGVVYAVDQGGGKSSVVVRDNQAPTLTCTHDGSPAVAYSFDPGASRDVGVLFIEECAKTLTNGTCPGHHDGVVIANKPIAIDRATFNQGENALYDPQISEDGTTSTLVAKGPSAVCYSIDEKCANTYVWEEQANTLAARDYKQPQAVCYEEDPKPVYIVRRLTPTECARLQGFADRWGDIDAKKKFTDEEYAFWVEVRNTHAAINGKKTKEYTKAQMLTWYNKLNTDGAEYKMWGNGIALPTALYVMQGIKEVSNESY